MAKILGLDLGTNSIGWAIVEKNNSDFTLIDKGVRIFSEGVNIEAKTNSESSKAAKQIDKVVDEKIKFLILKRINELGGFIKDKVPPNTFFIVDENGIKKTTTIFTK